MLGLFKAAAEITLAVAVQKLRFRKGIQWGTISNWPGRFSWLCPRLLDRLPQVAVHIYNLLGGTYKEHKS